MNLFADLFKRRAQLKNKSGDDGSSRRRRLDVLAMRPGYRLAARRKRRPPGLRVSATLRRCFRGLGVSW